jgi:purine-binding chemotaxis protein CheW
VENETGKNTLLNTQIWGLSEDHLNDEEESKDNVLINEEFKQYLTFYLNNELYGIELEYVKEVINYCKITRIPGIPDYIRGVINLRGNVMSAQ